MSTYDIAQAVIVALIVGAALVSATRRWWPRARGMQTTRAGGCGPTPCSTCGACATAGADMPRVRRSIPLRTIAGE